MLVYDLNHPVLKKCVQFLSCRKNSNVLINILSQLEDVANVEVIHAVAVQMIFEQLNEKKQLSFELINEGEAEYKYRKWLWDCYEKGYSRLLKILSQSHDLNVQKQALITLLQLSDYDVKNGLVRENPMSTAKLMDIFKVLIEHSESINYLIPVLKDYFINSEKNESGQFWISLASVLLIQHWPKDQNILNLLSIVESFSNKKAAVTYVYTKNSEIGGSAKNKAVCKSVDTVWNWCMRHHSPAILKNLLIALLEHFMPLLSNPIYLTDFLINALNAGGATSLLALQGIYILILKHNIDYPNIYGKLYMMLQPEILRMKYKTRFLYLLDLFLTSTHLPEQMVASFVKRLSRLALKSPPHDILILLPFVGNLLIRHPGLNVLINRPGGGNTDEDPFVVEENDPMHTRALDSSLWEVKSLQQHIIPQVSRFAMFISEPFPSVEWDLSNRLERTSDQMFDKERSKKAKMSTTVTFERPSSLSTPRGLIFDKIWLL